MKLELKHLIDAYKHQDEIIGSCDSWRINKISNEIVYLSNGLHENQVLFSNFQIDYKIVKHPLSDLTKEIEVNGEKFVPIVEICKISETVNKVLRINSKSNICRFDFINGIQEVLRFCYHFNTNHFQLTDEEGDNGCILHQMEMFEKLLEWHFDIYGLIENGLAIDINALEKLNNQK